MKKGMEKVFGKGSTKHGNGNENKIELLSCHLEKLKCTEHLKEINSSYSNAGISHNEKDFIRSIRLLKKAYFKATELKQESTCAKCSSLFRLTIEQSLEKINTELFKMSHGIFRKKRYELSYLESCNVLNEFKKND